MKLHSARMLGLLAFVGMSLLLVMQMSRSPIHAEPQTRDDDAETAQPSKAVSQVVRQGFPAADTDSVDLTKSETAWEVEWELTHPENNPMYPPGSVLRIRSAKFMWKDRVGKPQWITVVRMLEPSEIYVPYDNGWTAYLDIHDMSFHTTPARKEFLGPSCVRPGEILKSANPHWNNTVHKEVHDDGIRWMSAETDDNNGIGDRARRGEKMTLWSTYYGANYRYLIEYNFGDDGMITCRIGPTGRNIFDRQDDQKDTHLHIGCWRFEPDMGDPTMPETASAPKPPAVPTRRLPPGRASEAAPAPPSGPVVPARGGPKDNEILLARRVFDDAADRFVQVAKPFAKNGTGQSCEGSARWVPDEFTTLRIQSNSRKSAHGKPMSYDLIPLRYGAIRQLQNEGGSYSANMDFINQDFWVTHAESGFTSYVDVPQYASKRRPLAGNATTIWTCTPALHVARGEDFGSDGGKNSYSGVAITTWAGFSLKPRDVLDNTPLYDPPKPRSRRYVYP